MLPVTHKWTNWARTESSQPATTVAPRTAEQAVAAVVRARETGHTVKPIGASHSFTGIGATDGVRVDMSRMRGLVGANTAKMQATLWGGTHLWEVPALLAPLGLAMPNLGDIDRQTITGATQTGTHGTGIGFGGISTTVIGAQIVTGTGEMLDVDERNNPELLPAVALGLGALGVVLTVTLQCVPRFVLHAEEAPAALDDVLTGWEDRVRGTDHFEFFWFPHTSTVRTKTNTRLPLDSPRKPRALAAKFLDEELANNVAFGACTALGSVAPGIVPRLNRMVESVSSRRSYSDESHRVLITNRRVHFREMEYAVPLEAVPSVVREVGRMIDRHGFRVSFPVEVRAAAADDLMLSTAHGRESGYIAVHRYWRELDTNYFREAEAILAAHDGRPHWGKMHTLGAEQLRARYPRFDDFVAARDRLDPDRVFANPYLTRVLGE